MILKIWNEVENGWTFIGDAQEVTTNKKHCIHVSEDSVSFPLVIYNGTGDHLVLTKNHGFLFGADEILIKEKEEYGSEKDVYIVQIFIVTFKSGNKKSYVVKQSTGAYLLNDEGKTIEHL